MYLYKKNIILVPTDFDGVSMAKGILSLDCYADKTVCSLRTYNLLINKNLTLGVVVNKKLNKVSVSGALNSQKFEFPLMVNNADNISVVLLDINQENYNIVLWGSTELNSSWRSTLEFMLKDQIKPQNVYDNTDSQQNVKKQTFNEINNFNADCYNTQNFSESCLNSYNQQINNQILKNEFKNINKNDFNNHESFCINKIEQNFNNDGSNLNQTQGDFTNQSEMQSQYKKADETRFILNSDNYLNNTEILKNQNLDEFLDSVINTEPSDESAIYDEFSSNLQDEIHQQNSFYERIKYQIEKMFVANQQEKLLDEIIPNSKFCRVEFDDKTGHYVFGVIYENQNPKYLCYGVPAKKNSEPPKELTSYYQWLPIDVQDENGDGYYMMYQDANTGKNISIEIV